MDDLWRLQNSNHAIRVAIRFHRISLLKKLFDPRNVTCYKCKEKGHLARTSPSRNKNGGERDESKSRDYAFVVSSEETQGRSKVRNKSDEPFREIIDKVLAADNAEAWLTDSGASRPRSSTQVWALCSKTTDMYTWIRYGRTADGPN